MKVQEILFNDGKNLKKAKKIRAALKNKAKDNNPSEPETRGGWEVDPHQGTFNQLRMTR